MSDGVELDNTGAIAAIDAIAAKIGRTRQATAEAIIAIADAYDAMTQTRSYRAHLGRNEAVAELLRSSPSQFDPDLVVAFLTVLTGNRS